MDIIYIRYNSEKSCILILSEKELISFMRDMTNIRVPIIVSNWEDDWDCFQDIYRDAKKLLEAIR